MASLNSAFAIRNQIEIIQTDINGLNFKLKNFAQQISRDQLRVYRVRRRKLSALRYQLKSKLKQYEAA